MIVPNGVDNYLLYSDELEFDNQDMITLVLRRINNIYLLKAFIGDVPVDKIIDNLESGGG